MIAVLAGTAVLSYAYAKSEIMSAAGVFYALVVYFAVRELGEVLVRLKPDPTPRVRSAFSNPVGSAFSNPVGSAFSNPVGSAFSNPVGSAFRRTIVIVLVLFVGTAGAWRAMGLPDRLQRGALEARSEWVLRMPPFSPPAVQPSDARLTPRLLDEALHRGRTNPFLLWPPYARLWGEN
jgi:hypothetical protein